MPVLLLDNSWSESWILVRGTRGDVRCGTAEARLVPLLHALLGPEDGSQGNVALEQIKWSKSLTVPSLATVGTESEPRWHI